MSTMRAFAHDSSDESSGEEGDFAFPSTDPNADEDFGDFNPRKRRRTGRDAKESAALGIFGSESEDDGPGKRWKKRTALREKGVSFVSIGKKKLDEDDEDDDDGANQDADMQDEDEDEEDAPKGGLGFGSQRPDDEDGVPRAGFGLGIGASRGLGFQKSTPTKPTGLGSSRNTPLGKGFVPTSAATPILRSDIEDEAVSRQKWRSAFDAPTSGSRGKSNSKPMSFGEKMMAKQGWTKGTGLGKDGQGRTGIIETQLRPQGVGLGAVREKSKQEKDEEKRQATLRGDKYEDSDEERKRKARRPKVGGTRTSSGISTPKRVKPKFRTMQEIQKEAPGLEIPDSFATILDLTGPGKKLLTSTSGLMTPTAGSETLEQSESRKLARRAQSDVSAFVEEWKSLQERKAYNELQLIEQRQEIEAALHERQEFERVKVFADLVNESQQGEWDAVYAALLSIAEAEQPAITNLPIVRSEHHDIISNLAIAAVHPFIKDFVQDWQPLKDPIGLVPSLSKIRHLLGCDEPRTRAKATTPYETMIHQVIFPKIASTITRSWDFHDPTPLLALLDAWNGLLPAFVRAQIIDQTVVGKLNDAVSNWKPRKSRPHELPHLWLFPWLQYLAPHHADPESKTGLVTDVKRKFRQLIDSWDFRKGVIPGLQQWREVLRPSSKKDMWTPLIMNHVLPRMAQYLKDPRNFIVDPQDQEPYLASLQGIFAWQEILGAKTIGQVIVEVVFPMWHSVLYQWLTGTNQNYGEIEEWFEWWSENVFPKEIQNLNSIQQEFQKGTELIDHALDLGSKAATDLPPPYHSQSYTSIQKAKSPSPAATVSDPAPVELTFRDRVHEWCQENDIFMVPERKVMHPQGPLYRITAAGDGKTGGVFIYFKGDRLLVVQKSGDLAINWEDEISKDALIGMAHHNVR